jgi:hypothetical protein
VRFYYTHLTAHIDNTSSTAYAPSRCVLTFCLLTSRCRSVAYEWAKSVLSVRRSSFYVVYSETFDNPQHFQATTHSMHHQLTGSPTPCGRENLNVVRQREYKNPPQLTDEIHPPSSNISSQQHFRYHFYTFQDIPQEPPPCVSASLPSPPSPPWPSHPPTPSYAATSRKSLTPSASPSRPTIAICSSALLS